LHRLEGNETRGRYFSRCFDRVLVVRTLGPSFTFWRVSTNYPCSGSPGGSRCIIARPFCALVRLLPGAKCFVKVNETCGNFRCECFPERSVLCHTGSASRVRQQ